MYIKRNLPTFDIVNLDTGETQEGMYIPKEVEKITIGDDSLCYITMSKNLYINHQIKDNILEVNVANGNNIVITKYESADFKQMAKDLKAKSIIKEDNQRAFKSIDCKDGAARFFAMVGNPESKDNYVVYILMEYKNIVYKIKRKYIESQDKLIDYDEEIDGKLSFKEKYFDSSEASTSIINNMKK